MKTLIALLPFFLVAFAFSPLSKPNNGYPHASGWVNAGSKPKAYDMGIDSTMAYSGKGSATIKSKKKMIDGFGTLLQSMKAADYLGKRLRITGYIKSKKVKDWAGLWMRLDGHNTEGKYEMTGFDNMGDRPIKGTTDWKEYEVVLDITKNTDKIFYGVLLSGTGQVWFDDLKFDVVDNSVPVTDKEDPSNLDFEK